MRYLVVSDIHGNLAALEAVLAEPHDAVICLGDIVGYGPEPLACLRWIRREAKIVVQGNHDRAAATGADPGCRPAFRWLAAATAPIASRELEDSDRRYLGDLPHWLFIDVDGLPTLAVHATPSDTLYRYLGPKDLTAWQDEVSGIPANLVLVGHTHLPFDIHVAGVRVVNPGSVGQPKDGDPRAAYAVIDNGFVELKRAAYPIERTVLGLQESGVAPEAAAVLGSLLRHGRLPPDPART
jgi:predicted phosphodiesterase